MLNGIRQKLNRQLILFLARRLPACDVMTRLFSESRDRPVLLREKIIMRLHLFTCRGCRRYVEQIEKMSRMIKPQTKTANVAEEPTVKLSNEARERIKAALIAAGNKR